MGENYRAYRTGCWDMFGITFAPSRAKARYASYRAAHEAGFAPTFADMKCRRAPEYDRYFLPQYKLKSFVADVIPAMHAYDSTINPAGDGG
jgi:hypothetical protein